MQPTHVSRFAAIYSSGAFVPDSDAVTALALLFDRVYLPNNIELIKAFASKYRVSPVFQEKGTRTTVTIESDGTDDGDLFTGLGEMQKTSVENYLMRAVSFAHTYSDLYGPVFESDMFPDKTRLDIGTKRSAAVEGHAKVTFTLSNRLSFSSGDEDRFPELLSRGYVPVVGKYHAASPTQGALDPTGTKHLATLLAMKSVSLVLPRTRSARPDQILEARHRLREHLPPFWSSMLKTSVELRKIAKDAKGDIDLVREAEDLVDRTVRPAVIDLAAKLEKERRDWFYRILAPVRSGLRLLVGSPPLTQQQLVSSAMVLASDTCVAIAENMRSIEALKRESGLAYLLELSNTLSSGEGET